MSIVDINSGKIIAFLEFEGTVEEIFDVQILAGVRFPTVVGLKKDTIRRACVIGPEEPVLGLSPPAAGTPSGSTNDAQLDPPLDDSVNPSCES